MARVRLSGVAFLVVCLVPTLAANTGGDKKDKKTDSKKSVKDKIKEIAGTAEFLRDVPKHFATLKAVDARRGQVTLLLEGEVLPKVWSLAADAEIKVMGWWGRLDHLGVGDRVWVWFKTDRKKQAVAISMIADEPSEQDIHGPGLLVEAVDGQTYVLKPVKGPLRKAQVGVAGTAEIGDRVYLQSRAGKTVTFLSTKAFEAARDKQKVLLRERWLKEGLPGTVGFVHVFSGEMDLILDHETMRWARSLKLGDQVSLAADPPIKALVKHVQPWRERTQLRLVVKSFDLAELSSGQRLNLLRPPPPPEVDTAVLPPDVDRPRATKQERIEWFLASIYCTCGVAGDRCTGHFYSLASCNPNGCGMPNHMRGWLAERIDQGKTDRQIFEELIQDQGPNVLKPHLLP